jgi:hypothetical protein
MFELDDIIGYCTKGHPLTKYMHQLALRCLSNVDTHVPLAPTGSELYDPKGPLVNCRKCMEGSSGGERMEVAVVLNLIANSIRTDCVKRVVCIQNLISEKFQNMVPFSLRCFE